MSDEIDNQIKQRLSNIFPDEQTKDRIIKMVTEPERPEGWGSQSYAPFYRPYFGEQMKAMADVQIETHQDICYDYSVYCTPWVAGGCSTNTLYNRVNQSIRYLLEKMDPTGKYKQWRAMVRVKREDDLKCVRVFVIPEISVTIKGGGSAPLPRMSEPVEVRPRWKRELDAWIEDPEQTKPFIKNNLILSVEEQELLKAELAGLRHIECMVDSSSVRAIKVNL